MNILILARMTTSFNGSTIKSQPLGGSESALYYLSRELARRGHRVVISNNCFNGAGIYDSVEYRHFTTLLDLVAYSKKEDFDVFVSLRDLPAFLFGFKAKKKIWWGHDDFSNIYALSNPLLRLLGLGLLRWAGWMLRNRVDKYFVVSRWLGSVCHQYLGIPESKIFIAHNGVDLDYFVGEIPEREPYRLIYSSVPDRGLDILAEVFPRIKKEIPEVELYAYTGGQLGILKPEDKVRAENLIKAAQLAGIKIMGNIPRKDLARELQKSSLMVYPSHAVPEAAFYAETSCMAALEAQAAGVPVVASKRGALPETIQDQKTGILIDGDPFSLEYQDKFIEQTVSLLNDPERWKKFSKNAQDYIQSRYSWKTIAQEWEKEFNRIIGL